MTEGTQGHKGTAGGLDAHGGQEPEGEIAAMTKRTATPSLHCRPLCRGQQESQNRKKSYKITREPLSQVEGTHVCRWKGACLGVGAGGSWQKWSLKCGVLKRNRDVSWQPRGGCTQVLGEGKPLDRPPCYHDDAPSPAPGINVCKGFPEETATPEFHSQSAFQI